MSLINRAESGGQGGFLLHPVAIGVNGVVAGLLKPENLEQLFHAALHLRPVQLVQVADKMEQFASR
jgi:hypothetical protein